MSAKPCLRVVFVCTGNICRSPMAEIVLRAQADEAGLGARLTVTSAGTGDWHVGEHADHRTIAALARRGYDGSAHRARQFTPSGFDDNDLVIALDRGHKRILTEWAGSAENADKISLLLEYGDADVRDVPDPYYGGAEGFDETLSMIEEATSSLFSQLEPALRRSSAAPLARATSAHDADGDPQT